MSPQVIKETISTPLVNYSLQEKLIKIKGISMPENPIAFYQELFNWITKNKEVLQDELILEIELEYFNSSSALILGDLMKKVSKLGASNKILWQYVSDDEDLKEAGKEYQLIIGDQVILEKV